MDVVTFGEAMVVFNPAKMGSLTNVHSFYKTIGGAEANVAIGLQRLGHRAGFFTRLGNDPFGHSILKYLKGEGVDTTKINFDTSYPTGIYFKEKQNVELMNVYYYRRGSATSVMDYDDIDEDYIKRAKYLHVSGITPFLSKSCEKVVYESIRIAKKNNVLVCFDPNIRFKLMDNINKGKELLMELASLSDIVLPGISEGEFLTGGSTPEEISETLLSMGPRLVVIKLGENGAYFKTKEEENYVKGVSVKHVVDSTGAGDGFVAGLLSGLLKNYSTKKAVELANTVGAMNVMCEGDNEGLPTMDELQQFIASDNDIVR